MSETTLFLQFIKVWKMIGCGFWSFWGGFFVVFLLKIFLKYFGISNSTYFVTVLAYCYTFIFGIISMIFYFACLQVVPLQYSVLKISQLFARLVFIISLIAWLFNFGLLAVSSKESLIISLIISAYIAFTNTFVVQISLIRKSRFSRIWSAYHFPYLAAIVISIVAFRYAGVAGVLCTVFEFIISSLFMAICSSIAGERTSLASRNGRLLISALCSQDNYLKLLGFIDLDAISGGPSSRRSFIFRDASRSVMIQLMSRCSQAITAFQHQNWQLQQYKGPNVYSAQISNLQYRDAARQQPLIQKKKENIITRILRNRREDAMKKRRESYALQASIPAIYATKSLVRLVALFETEDTYGVGQASMDEMYKMFVSARDTIQATEGYHWSIKSFGDNWIGRSPQAVIRQSLSILNWGINEINARRSSGRRKY